MYWRWVLLLALCGSLVFDSPAIGAPPGDEPPVDREFIPNAGFLQTVKRLRAIQRAGILSLAPGFPLNISGTRSLPVILVEFNNRSAPFTAAEHQSLLFSEAATARSMTNYYKAISAGKFSVTGEVIGPFKLPSDDVTYEGSNNGLGGANFGDLLQSALKKADVATDFGRFDNDGPDGFPNSGDDDGVVDTCFFIHPETGGECGNGSKNIWSHSWHYSEGLGHSGSFVTNDVSNRVDPDTGILIPNAKILVEDYTIQPAQACGSTSASKKIIPIGVFCHEYGHALGLPDLYDRSPPGDGIGAWCLMASGSYGGDNVHADRPTRMSAWCKYYLGWADVHPLASILVQDFLPVDQGNRMYRFNVPGTDDLEYFLIEYRRKTDWDEFLRTGGLAIWHIDESVGADSPTWPFTPKNEGQNDSPNRVQSHPNPLFATAHSLVALIQADGKMDLENPTANSMRGDATDLFTSGNFEDDATGKRGSRGYSGQATGLALRNIQVSLGGVKAQVVVGATVPPAVELAAAPPAAEASADAQFVTGINAAVQKEGIKGLSQQQIERLKTLPRHVLHSATAGRASQVMLSTAAKARTSQVTMTSYATAPLSAHLKAIVELDSDQSITVQYSPSQKAVEHISDLSVDASGIEPVLNAQGQLSGVFGELVGKDVKLSAIDTVKMDQSDRVVRFSQTVKVGERSLPLFGKQVAIYYNKGKLIGLSSSSVQSDLTITGTLGSMRESEAKKIASKVLGIPAINLTAVEGVALKMDDPKQAHIAYKVSAPSGPKRRGLEVIIDTTDKRVQVK